MPVSEPSKVTRTEEYVREKVYFLEGLLKDSDKSKPPRNENPGKSPAPERSKFIHQVCHVELSRIVNKGKK